MTTGIRSGTGLALALAGATFFAAGCGGVVSASVSGSRTAAGTPGVPSRHMRAVDIASAALPGGAVAMCRGLLRDGRNAGSLPPGQVRLTRTATVALGGAAGGPVAPGRTVPCAWPGLQVRIHLCPPGFWRLHRLSVSAGHHPGALFPFPGGCGAARKTGPAKRPSVTPLPLVPPRD